MHLQPNIEIYCTGLPFLPLQKNTEIPKKKNENRFIYQIIRIINTIEQKVNKSKI